MIKESGCGLTIKLMPWLFAFVGIFLCLGGLMYLKLSEQEKADRERKTYRLHFPAGLEAEAITAWIRSLAGSLRSTSPMSTSSMVFEVWSSPTGIEHYLKVPWQHADYVISQLLAHVPGISYTADISPRRLLRFGVDLKLSKGTRPLRIDNPGRVSSTILASLQSMEDDEAVVIQWVLTPTLPDRLPTKGAVTDQKMSSRPAGQDEINERRTKLTEPNVVGALRVGATANTTKRAEHLVSRVSASLSSVRTASTHFKKRFATPEQIQDRIDRGATPFTFGLQLSAPEVTALLGWPINSPFIAGLPPALARRLPASPTVPTQGRVIGRSNMAGRERPVALAYSEAVKHMWVMAPTGAGKTTMLANMVRQDVESGHGVIVIESKGDLFEQALDYIPYNRLNDVIVLDVNDRRNPVGFNILQQGASDSVVDELGAMFERLYDTKGVWSREVLFHGLQTLITDPKMTFVDLVPLLVPMTTEEIEWSDQLKRDLKDRELKNFWQRMDNKGQKDIDRFAQPVLDRVWQLNARPEIRRIIGQSESSFSMDDVIKGNKILLVNLSGVPKETASLMGTLLVNAIWRAVRNNRTTQPNFLYLDEFADFTNLPVDPEEFLAKARSYGLGLVLAHQHLKQLPVDLKSAVLANARTKVVFQTGADDADVVSREFGTVSRDDFLNLGKFEAFARVSTGDGVSPPLSLASVPPLPKHGFRHELIRKSRETYGRPVEAVDNEITARRLRKGSRSGKRPRISGTPED